MGLLDRKKLLKKQAFKIEKVDLGLDEKGEEEYVFVRQMSGRERDQFEQSLLKEKMGKNGVMEGYEKSLEDFRAKLAVVTICDENGENILSAGDFETLSKNMMAVRIEKIITAAQKINSITEEDKEALTKNSDAGEVGSSTSDSAEN
jgi:hypothetical protein